MTKLSVKWYALCLLVCSLLVIVYYLMSHSNGAARDRVWMTPVRLLQEVKYHPPTRFLYLVQTESCLPDKLQTSIGNASNCQCDILVLSYKQECTRNLTPSHIEYIISNSSTTWATGRNLLYEVAMRRSERYLYYIFMDDDIELRYHDGHEQKTGSPWREFEQFLKRVEPAVATVNKKGNKFDILKLARECPIEYETMKTGYFHTVWFDAMFDAFHHQAVEYLLPYNSKFDKQSWWYSQIYIIIWSELLFRGQVIMYAHIDVINGLHRPYPRYGKGQSRSTTSVTPFIVEDIGKELPKRYRNMSLFLEWEENGWNYCRKTSSTYCLPPPELHQLIEPYAHFNQTF